MWTRFMDMYSGGQRKLDWEYIYIEADEETAKKVFYHRFGRNPECVTCTCCGSDYSIQEGESLEEATEFDRKWLFGHPATVEEYFRRADVLSIPAADIKPEERLGEIPEEGYVWR